MEGELNITDYCHKMKTMADALQDLGHDVSDRQLMLNILRGLNRQFDHRKTFIKCT
jgi:hypothetical protein